jgi:hypothetical protein
MVRHVPDAGIYQWHPGGGQYDMLTVFMPGVDFLDGRIMDINRVGSIRIYPDGNEELISWKEALNQSWPVEFIDRIERRLGIVNPEGTPRSTPKVIAYRVITGLLRATQSTSDSLKVHMAFVDSSDGVGGGGFSGLGPDYGHAEAHEAGLSSSTEREQPGIRFWSISHDQKILGYIHDSGFLFMPKGITLDLGKLYAKHKRNINRLIALELTDLISRSAR